jgi:hypothetical protein
MEEDVTLHHQQATAHTDGSAMFLRQSDSLRQDQIAAWLGHAWGMQFRYMGNLSFIDYIGVRQERPVCWVEIISRVYAHDELMRMGGVYLKRKTWETLRAIAAVPLSVSWLGAYVVWDLKDGLYSVHINSIPDYKGTAYDPRGASNDTEPAVLVRHLTRIA